MEHLHDLRRKYEQIRDLRKKVRAHRDEHTAYAIVHREDSERWMLDDHLLFEAIGDMKDLMIEILSRLSIGNPYAGEVEGPDGNKLIAALARRD